MALEFILKLNDYMTPKLGAAAKAADSAVAKMNQRADASARKMGLSMDGARKKVEDLRAAANKSTDWTMLKSGLREAAKLERQLDKVQAKAEGKKGGGLTSLMGGALKPLLAAASVGAVISFGASSVKAAMDFGATSKSYEVLAGDAAKGRGLANNLNKLQQDTILGPEVFKAGQTLMSFGMSVDKVMPVMKQLGDVSMGNSQRFEALTLAFAQTQSAGKLMGQDLLQYVNAGFNPLQTMSEKWKEFGFKSQMSVGQLRKAMEGGKISSQMVARSFEIATSKGGKFADMMDTIATTSFGKMKILEGQYENFKINVGNALMPLAESLMTVGSKTLDWLNISKSAPEVLNGEIGEINMLVKTITELNSKNDLRGKLISQLVTKYPEYFSNIDKESVSNNKLLDTLNGINRAYQKKIDLASSDLVISSNKKIIGEEQPEWIRKSTIASSLQKKDFRTAKNNMKWYEELDYDFGHWLKGNAQYVSNYKSEAADSKTEVEKATAENSKEEFYNRALKKRDELESVYNYSNFKGWDKKRLGAFYSEKNKLRKIIETGGLSTYTNTGLLGFDNSKMNRLIDGNGNPANTNTAADNAAKTSSERAMSGQKQINITIQSLGGIEKIEMHGADTTKGFDEIEKKVKETFLRVVNSAIGLADN